MNSENNMSYREDIHDTCIELIPWYVSQSLDEIEKSMMEDHLSTCLVCRRELEDSRDLQHCMLDLENHALAQKRAFSKLIQRIESENNSGSNNKTGTHQLFAWIQKLKSGFLSVPVFYQRAFIVQTSVLLLVIGTLAFNMPVNQSGQDEGYVYYGLTDVASNIQGEFVRYYLKFSEGATEKDVREILLSMNGEIVRGPTVSGMYVVDFPTQAKSGQEVMTIEEKLQQYKNVRFPL